MHEGFNGISLIIADSYDEVLEICKILGVEGPSQMKSFELLYLIDPETVFFAVMPRKQQMMDFAGAFKLKRCVISFGGVREASGVSLDWLKKILGNKTAKPCGSTERPVQIFGEQVYEKDDPFLELGYAR